MTNVKTFKVDLYSVFHWISQKISSCRVYYNRFVIALSVSEIQGSLKYQVPKTLIFILLSDFNTFSKWNSLLVMAFAIFIFSKTDAGWRSFRLVVIVSCCSTGRHLFPIVILYNYSIDILWHIIGDNLILYLNLFMITLNV